MGREDGFHSGAAVLRKLFDGAWAHRGNPWRARAWHFRRHRDDRSHFACRSNQRDFARRKIFDIPRNSAARFNSYGSRRGNDLVMTRGTFANVRIKNLMVPGTEGGVTKFYGSATVPVAKGRKSATAD